MSIWPWSTIRDLRSEVASLHAQAASQADIVTRRTAEVISLKGERGVLTAKLELANRQVERLDADVEGYKSDVRRLTAQLVASSAHRGTLNPHFDPFAEDTKQPDQWLTGEDVDPNELLDKVTDTSGEAA